MVNELPTSPIRGRSGGSPHPRFAPGSGGAKMSLLDVKSKSVFDRILSDLCCLSGVSIGALGKAPTFPDDSEAEREDCVIRVAARERWRGYGYGS